MVLLVVFVLTVSLAVILEVSRKKPQTTIAPPENAPTPSPVVNRPFSRWATDSGVLAIESELKTLSEDLKNVDLKESGLLPPVLDMEVKF